MIYVLLGVGVANLAVGCWVVVTLRRKPPVAVAPPVAPVEPVPVARPVIAPPAAVEVSRTFDDDVRFHLVSAEGTILAYPNGATARSVYETNPMMREFWDGNDCRGRK